MNSLDEMLAKIENAHQAYAFFLGLDVWRERIQEEQIALLNQYLDTDPNIKYGTRMICARKKIIRGNNSFEITTDEETIVVNKNSIPKFTILPMDMYKAPNYDKLDQAVVDIRYLQRRLRNDWEELSRTTKFFISMKDNGFHNYLDTLLGDGANIRGTSNKAFLKSYRKHLFRDLRHFFFGLGASALGLYALFGNPASAPEGSPPPRASMTRMTDSKGNVIWSPDGHTIPLPADIDEGSDAEQQETESFKNLQDQFLGQGGFAVDPQRMLDIRKPYLDLTTTIPFKPKYDRDFDDSEGFFPSRKNTTYALSPKGVRATKPEVDSLDRSLLLIYDVTSSMGDPQSIIDPNPKPLPSYFLATQLVKSYAQMGATIRIMRYPLEKVVSAAIFETNSMDAALEELLYTGAGADDANAVMAVGTLYITEMNRRNTSPMDVVVITDRGPTYQMMVDFMDLEEKNRGKDTMYWINSNPALSNEGGEDVHFEKELLVYVSQLERRDYFQLQTLKGARIIARTIIEGYKR